MENGERGREKEAGAPFWPPLTGKREEKRKELSTSITIFHIWEGKGRESDSCLVLLEGGTVDKMCPRKEKGGKTRFFEFWLGRRRRRGRPGWRALTCQVSLSWRWLRLIWAAAAVEEEEGVSSP